MGGEGAVVADQVLDRVGHRANASSRRILLQRRSGQALETAPRPANRSAGSPNGVRTRVSTLRGWCPRPLDDGTSAAIVPTGLGSVISLLLGATGVLPAHGRGHLAPPGR